MSKSIHFLAVLAVLLMTTEQAEARPVSYAEGSMIMASHDKDRAGIVGLYSPTARFSFGPLFEFNCNTDSLFGGLQANYLLKRWNNFDSQGNLYLLSALGLHGINGSADDRAGGYGGFQADWEDRRYYTSYDARYRFDGEDSGEFFEHKARVGIAPYIAEFGALHTWLMLQVEHEPERKDSFTVTPLVRVFQGPVLAEAGISFDGDLLLNLDITF